MPIVYKIDIITELKARGYNTNRLRKEKLLSEGVLQSLRTKSYISMDNLAKICALLDCQPADLIAYEKEPSEGAEYASLFYSSKRRKDCGRGLLNDAWRAVCAFVGVGYYFGWFTRWMHFLFLAWAFFPRRVIFVSANDILDCQRNDKNSPTHDGDGDERKKRRADRESPLLGTCVL